MATFKKPNPESMFAGVVKVVNTTWGGMIQALLADTSAGTLTWTQSQSVAGAPRKYETQRPYGRHIYRWDIRLYPDPPRYEGSPPPGISLGRLEVGKSSGWCVEEADCTQKTAQLLRDLYQAVTSAGVAPANSR